MDPLILIVLLLAGSILGILLLLPMFRTHANGAYPAPYGYHQQYTYTPIIVIVLLGIIMVLILALRGDGTTGFSNYLPTEKIIPNQVNEREQIEKTAHKKHPVDPNRILYKQEENERFSRADQPSPSTKSVRFTNTNPQRASLPNTPNVQTSQPVPERFTAYSKPSGYAIQIGAANSYTEVKQMILRSGFKASFVGITDPNFAFAYKALIGHFSARKSDLKPLLRKVQKDFPEAYIVHSNRFDHIEPATAF